MRRLAASRTRSASRVVLRTELFLWRNQRRRKFCVSDHAIKRKKTGCEDKRPEDDATGEWMNSLSQRNQTGNAGDDQREQANRHQHDKRNNDFPRAKGLLCCGFNLHDSNCL